MNPNHRWLVLTSHRCLSWHHMYLAVHYDPLNWVELSAVQSDTLVKKLGLFCFLRKLGVLWSRKSFRKTHAHEYIYDILYHILSELSRYNRTKFWGPTVLFFLYDLLHSKLFVIMLHVEIFHKTEPRTTALAYATLWHPRHKYFQRINLMCHKTLKAWYQCSSIIAPSARYPGSSE